MSASKPPGVDTRTRSWNEIQQLAAKQMAPIPVGFTEDMPGHGCYTTSALTVGDRVRRLPLEVYQSEGVIETFRSSGLGRPLALVRFAQASYSVLVNQDELVRV